MKIAVEGCAHGELQKIYDTIQSIEKEQQLKVDLLLCCGDFQSTRNLDDLQTMAVPKKYQDICTFYKYYSGELVAPILTIFVGGNHEASNYLQELPYGGWVAPNIYYLGYAGVVRVNGVRIAGLSGIYKGHDFLRGRHEFSPYTDSTRVSVYHVRQLEVFRLKQLSGRMDICISHDWPRGIYNHGNKAQLARFKPHFRDEMDNNQLGSRPCEELLAKLQPSYWFAAHLHCKFAAVVTHCDDTKDGADDCEPTERVTKFLALDKCLPKRRFLQLFDFDAPSLEGEPGEQSTDLRLEYDAEWLAILQLTNHLISVKNTPHYMPGPRGTSLDAERYNFTPTEEELECVRKKFGDDLRIPLNFCRTVAPYSTAETVGRGYPAQPAAQINPQSTQFCDMLGLDDPVSLAMLIGGHELNHSSAWLDTSDAGLTDTSSILDVESSLNISTTSEASPLKRPSTVSLKLPLPNHTAESTDDRAEPTATEEPDQTAAAVAMHPASSCANPDEVKIGDSSEDEAAPDHVDTEAALCQPVAKTPSTSVDEPAATPPVKRFRRRNQEMYQTEKDEPLE